MSKSLRLPFLASVALVLGLGRADLIAQQKAVSTYGIDAPSVAVIGAWEMSPYDSGTTWSSAKLNTYRYLTNAGVLYGNLHLPQGATLLSMELDACDSSPLEGVGASLVRVDATGILQLAFTPTGDVPTPGCARFSAPVTPAPVTVDNYLYTYLVTVQNATFTGNTTIGAIRVIYKLQVSPAPAVATFNDVPTTDTGFQYIEALVAAGITAGCGGGNYCPDALLTRRQMAVFISRALGLQWPEVPEP